MASNGTGTKDSRREATCGTFLAPWALTVLMVVPMDLAGCRLRRSWERRAPARWAVVGSRVLSPTAHRAPLPSGLFPSSLPLLSLLPSLPSLSLSPPLPLALVFRWVSAKPCGRPSPPPRPPPALPPGRVAGPACRSFVLLLSSRLPARPCPPLVSFSGFPSEALMPSLWPFGATRLRTSILDLTRLLNFHIIHRLRPSWLALLLAEGAGYIFWSSACAVAGHKTINVSCNTVGGCSRHKCT